MKIVGSTLLLIDNEAMLKACGKDGASSRTRYFERATMFVKEAAMRLIVALRLVKTDDEVADVFTKAVPLDTLKKMVAYMFNTGK